MGRIIVVSWMCGGEELWKAVASSHLRKNLFHFCWNFFESFLVRHVSLFFSDRILQIARFSFGVPMALSAGWAATTLPARLWIGRPGLCSFMFFLYTWGILKCVWPMNSSFHKSPSHQGHGEPWPPVAVLLIGASNKSGPLAQPGDADSFYRELCPEAKSLRVVFVEVGF